ncbi:uncharacterized protein LOC116849411 [Odontomachus brunneus]|uniref:uncharacterized protein LOC116849411 n=1 Tax=Odontomachus brunneus TaxID=486640 RepID=UPI0013F1934C|nr:uncharacterized protein LOC116849411 [Odontomachus brunneus]XP_032682436.1 uncharacterized protein LOC116849411 [Odontomachus brunneus]
MMPKRSHTGQIGGVFFNAFLVGVITLLIYQNIAKAEEVPAFFLKIAKIPTVPRVGRSGKFEDFFYKAEKHIPRIGRNIYSQSNDPLPSQNEQETYSDLTKRRIDYSTKVAQDSWSWQNFPLAIEGPKELWRTLSLYARDDTDDIDNEVWHRKKRTGPRPVITQTN